MITVNNCLCICQASNSYVAAPKIVGHPSGAMVVRASGALVDEGAPVGADTASAAPASPDIASGDADARNFGWCR
jgi:hypothetical protein